MEKEFTILIADRNPHIREFLAREMRAIGYRVLLARTGKEVLQIAYSNQPLDLVILDPDLPDQDGRDTIKSLQDRIPTLPLVIHGFISDYVDSSKVVSTGIFVEKTGSSIELLSKLAFEVLNKTRPHKPKSEKGKTTMQGESPDESKKKGE